MAATLLAGWPARCSGSFQNVKLNQWNTKDREWCCRKWPRLSRPAQVVWRLFSSNHFRPRLVIFIETDQPLRPIFQDNKTPAIMQHLFKEQGAGVKSLCVCVESIFGWFSPRRLPPLLVVVRLAWCAISVMCSCLPGLDPLCAAIWCMCFICQTFLLLIADFSSCFLFSGWNSSLWLCVGFWFARFLCRCAMCRVWWWWWCEWCGESAQAAATLWCETARLLPARREEGKEWKMWIEHWTLTLLCWISEWNSRQRQCWIFNCNVTPPLERCL